MIFAVLQGVLTSCGTSDKTESKAESKNDTETVSLKDDFYTAVNYDWLESADIPENGLNSDYYDICSKNISEFYKNYVEGLSSKKELSKQESRLLVLYEQFMEGQYEQSLETVKKYVQEIEKAKSLSDMEKLYSDKRLSVYNGLLNFEISGSKSSYVLRLNAVTLNGTDITKVSTYSFDEKIREQYLNSLKGVILKSGIYSEEKADAIAESAVSTETKILQGKLSENKDSGFSLYDSKSDFLFNVDLHSILDGMGYERDYQNIACDDFYMDLLNNEIFTEENVEALKNYLIAGVIYRALGSSEYNEKIGVTFERIADFYMKDVLVKGYLDENITDEDVDYLSQMAEKIISVYKKRIDKISYLSDSTKSKAKKKLDNLNVIVARPQTLIDYSEADVSDKNTYIQNCENCIIAKRNEHNRFLKTEFSRDKIVFDTMELNAYNSFGSNSIIIDAGIMQDCVYSTEKSFEENLGSIGTVIAHEVSHTLDITGSVYDENGVYKGWCNVNDRKAYIEKVNQLKDFMAKQGEKDGIELNATATRGEDIADLTGIQCCVEVLKEQKNPDYKKFFTEYAVIHREKCTDEVLEKRIEYDTHSPSKYRVNVPVQQIAEFYTAFDIKEGDGMYVPKSERISVW